MLHVRERKESQDKYWENGRVRRARDRSRHACQTGGLVSIRTLAILTSAPDPLPSSIMDWLSPNLGQGLQGLLATHGNILSLPSHQVLGGPFSSPLSFSLCCQQYLQPIDFSRHGGLCYFHTLMWLWTLSYFVFFSPNSYQSYRNHPQRNIIIITLTITN